MSWRRVHLLVGAIGLLLFLLSGQYMERIANVPQLDDTARMLYRSLHLYLMLSAAGNVFLALQAPTGGFLRAWASLSLLLSTPLLVASFALEASAGVMDRPVATAGLYLVFGAAVMLLADTAWRAFRAGRPR